MKKYSVVHTASMQEVFPSIDSLRMAHRIAVSLGTDEFSTVTWLGFSTIPTLYCVMTGDRLETACVCPVEAQHVMEQKPGSHVRSVLINTRKG